MTDLLFMCFKYYYNDDVIPFKSALKTHFFQIAYAFSL